MGGNLRFELGTKTMYNGMERLSSSSSSTAGGGEGEVREGVDWSIVATGIEPRIYPIPGLDHPNILSYVDVLRRDASVGHRVAIIGAGGI